MNHLVTFSFNDKGSKSYTFTKATYNDLQKAMIKRPQSWFIFLYNNRIEHVNLANVAYVQVTSEQ